MTPPAALVSVTRLRRVAATLEEGRAPHRPRSAHVYGGLIATLTAWCEHHGIPDAGVPVGTWKRALTGTGNANMAAVKALGYAPGSQDEADALGVLHHAMSGLAHVCEGRGGLNLWHLSAVDRRQPPPIVSF